MNKRIIPAVLLIATAGVADVSGPKPSLQVYVPRSAVAKTGRLRLGDLVVIRGGDAALRRKAAAAAMGRSPLPGEEIAFDRRTLVGRLAACGIPASRIRFTGAPKITIRRNDSVIAPEALLKAAQDYLQKHRPGPVGCGWKLASKTKPLVLPSREKTVLQVRPVPGNRPGKVALRISAVSHGRTLAHRDLEYSFTYLHRQAVTKKAISRGQTITTENTEIRTVSRDSAPDGSWNEPFGMLATRKLSAGTVLGGAALRTRPLQTVVRRNQPVVMTVRGPGFVLTAKGIAQQPGRPGDYIRVKNIDTNRTVVAKVRHDGTVEPMRR